MQSATAPDDAVQGGEGILHPATPNSRLLLTPRCTSLNHYTPLPLQRLAGLEMIRIASSDHAGAVSGAHIWAREPRNRSKSLALRITVRRSTTPPIPSLLVPHTQAR